MVTNLLKPCLATIALIALSACGGSLGDGLGSGHLVSNGARDSMIDERSPPPTDLVGLSNSGVIERLGTPEIARFEGGVLYWRFSTRDCLLDVYLSTDEATGQLAVEHMATRPRSYLLPTDACPASRQSRDSEL